MDGYMLGKHKSLTALSLCQLVAAATSVPSRRKPLRRHDLRKTTIDMLSIKVGGSSPNADPDLCLGRLAGVFTLFQNSS